MSDSMSLSSLTQVTSDSSPGQMPVSANVPGSSVRPDADAGLMAIDNGSPEMPNTQNAARTVPALTNVPDPMSGDGATFASARLSAANVTHHKISTPRHGRSVTRGGVPRNPSGPRSSSSSKHKSDAAAQLRLENAELRRKLSLSTSQVQHLAGVARTNENAWEHERAIGQQAVALSQQQVTHVAGVAHGYMDALHNEEARARLAQEQAHAILIQDEAKERLIQQQREEVAQMRSHFAAASQRQDVLVSELQMAAEQDRVHQEQYVKTMALYAEDRSKSQESEQLAICNGQHIQHLESMVVTQNQNFEKSQRAALLMGSQVAELKGHFETEYGKLEQVVISLRGELGASQQQYQVSCANYQKTFADLQEALEAIREKDEYIEALGQQLDVAQGPPKDHIPSHLVQKFLQEKQAQIDRLGQEVVQLNHEKSVSNGRIQEQDQIIAQLRARKLHDTEPQRVERPPREENTLPNALAGEEYWRDLLRIGNAGAHADVAPSSICSGVAGDGLLDQAFVSAMSSNPIAASNQEGTLKIPDAKALRPKQVNAPSFPNINSITTWLGACAQNLVAASVYDDHAEVKWLLEVKTKTFVELGRSKCEQRFSPLDALFAIALVKTLPPHLKRKYDDENIKALNNGSVVTGRQIVWLILQWFKTNDHMSVVYSYECLQELEWLGDKYVDEFLHVWNNIVDNLSEPLTPGALRDILFKKMVNSKVFAQDLAHFKREKAKAGFGQAAPDFTYDYLMCCLRRQVAEEHEEYQVEKRKIGLRHTARRCSADDGEERYPPAAPATPKARPKASAGAGGICVWHQKELRGEGKCRLGDKCKFKHEDQLSDDLFDELIEKKFGKRSNNRRQSPHPKAFVLPKMKCFQAEDGKKHPFCCREFLHNGSCADNDKGRCDKAHLNQKEYEDEVRKLNSD